MYVLYSLEIYSRLSQIIKNNKPKNTNASKLKKSNPLYKLINQNKNITINTIIIEKKIVKNNAFKSFKIKFILLFPFNRDSYDKEYAPSFPFSKFYYFSTIF